MKKRKTRDSIEGFCNSWEGVGLSAFSEALVKKVKVLIEEESEREGIRIFRELKRKASIYQYGMEEDSAKSLTLISKLLEDLEELTKRKG